MRSQGIVASLCGISLLFGCAGISFPDAVNPDSHLMGQRISVTQASDGREVIEAVPTESVLERFDMLADGGKRIAYVAFTDTGLGGLVFVDGKLLGSVSKLVAQTFYSCRGHATAVRDHWGSEGSAWAQSLLAATTPQAAVELDFSGKSTLQSINEVAGNAMITQLRSLVDMGTNPLSIFKTMSKTRADFEERQKYEKVLRGLRSVVPGEGEEKIASVARPEDMAFVSGGLVMAYQRFLIEFYLSGGVVKIIQQPSFHQLSRSYAGLFYLANVRWDLCTPEKWPYAVTELTHRDVPHYSPESRPGRTP